jgi:hypothetical protein
MPRKTFYGYSRYFSFLVAFAMPDNSAHLMLSKILPYQALAKQPLLLEKAAASDTM